MARFEPHSHTHYSNLRLIDAISKVPALIDRAIEIGLSGIAITDHETLSAAVEAKEYEAKIQKDNPDFKVAIGNEIYLTETRDSGQKYFHFILIAKDKIGFRMLRELSSCSWMQSYSDKGVERVPTLKIELQNMIKKYGKGHLIATSACLGGELSSLTWELISEKDEEQIYQKKYQIHNFILYCKNLFGNDFYIECAPGKSAQQVMVNQRLESIANAYQIKMVIGTDAHFLRKEDRFVHKAYLNSKDGDREVDEFYEFSYLQSEEEIKENLELNYELLKQNSEEIYNKIENYTIFHSQQIPKVEVKNYPKSTWWEKSEKMKKCPVLNSMFNSDDIQERYWINQCWEALKDKGIDWQTNFNYVERLEEEATTKRIIGEKLNTNLFSYPITLQKYIDMMWDCGSTIGAGRGSACSGLNHYLLGITQLDPVKWGLPFWRLELLRNSLPA